MAISNISKIQNIKCGRKIDKKGNKKCQHLPLQDLPKFTQIRIFGLKIHIPSGNTAPKAIFYKIDLAR
jgi:hypothetical protein